MLTHLGEHTLSRARDLASIGVSATTISRAVSSGLVLRIGCGLYQLPDAEINTYATLAEVAKRTPNAVICMMSALSFHGLTDQIPRKVWIAIGAKDWAILLPFLAAFRAQSKNALGQAFLLAGKDNIVRIDVPESAKQIALDDVARAIVELPLTARALVEGTGHYVNSVFLSDKASNGSRYL